MIWNVGSNQGLARLQRSGSPRLWSQRVPAVPGSFTGLQLQMKISSWSSSLSSLSSLNFFPKLCSLHYLVYFGLQLFLELGNFPICSLLDLLLHSLLNARYKRKHCIYYSNYQSTSQLPHSNYHTVITTLQKSKKALILPLLHTPEAIARMRILTSLHRSGASLGTSFWFC